jgi:hypothetical protein
MRTSDLLRRVHAEYRELPGLRLTVWQAARLFGVTVEVAETVLQDLRRTSVLTLSMDGSYCLMAEPSRSRRMDARDNDDTARDMSLPIR